MLLQYCKHLHLFCTTSCFHYMYFREAEEPRFHWQKTNIKVSSL